MRSLLATALINLSRCSHPPEHGGIFTLRLAFQALDFSLLDCKITWREKIFLLLLISDHGDKSGSGRFFLFFMCNSTQMRAATMFYKFFFHLFIGLR